MGSTASDATLVSVGTESRASATVATCAATVAIMLVFVLARMCVKAFVVKHLASEDYFCMVASFLSLGYFGLVLDLYINGFGVHQSALSGDQLAKLLKDLQPIALLWGPILFFTKLALLLLYLRLFNPNHLTKVLACSGIVFNFILYSSCFFLNLFLCHPTFDARCIDMQRVVTLVATSLSIASDFYTMAIPLHPIWNLQLSVKTKLELTGVFMTGSLACLASILVLYYRSGWYDGQDISWYSTPVIISTSVEHNIGIIVSCLPFMPALFRHLSPSRETMITLKRRLSSIKLSRMTSAAQSTPRTRHSSGPYPSNPRRILSRSRPPPEPAYVHLRDYPRTRTRAEDVENVERMRRLIPIDDYYFSPPNPDYFFRRAGVLPDYTVNRAAVNPDYSINGAGSGEGGFF